MITIGIGMEPVFLIEEAFIKADSVEGASHGLVEVDDPIQQGRCAHPGVESLTTLLAVVGVIVVPLEGGDGSAIDTNVLRVCLADNLLKDVDDIVSVRRPSSHVPRSLTPSKRMR